MSVEFLKYGDGEIVCKFLGRMDTTKCIDAEVAVMNSIIGAKKVIFDLGAVEYIASSFLRLCGKASHQVQSGNFSIINVTPSVKKVFKIAGLAEKLNLS